MLLFIGALLGAALVALALLPRLVALRAELAVVAGRVAGP